MLTSQAQFQDRLRSVTRKHAAMANGFTTHVRGDGLIVVKPKRRKRRGLSARGTVWFILGIIAFKSFMLASVGEANYADRLAKLSEGTILEQIGSWVMRVDPVTAQLANVLNPLL